MPVPCDSLVEMPLSILRKQKQGLLSGKKIAPRGSGAEKEDETLSLLYPSCKALSCQILKTIKEKCLLWEKGCKAVTLLYLDCLLHMGRQVLQNNSDTSC